MAVLGCWPDAYYHNSLDVIDTISPEAMGRFGRMAGAYLAFLATAGLDEAKALADLVVRRSDGVPPESQFARRLAESGCRVLVPTLIDRRLEHFEVEGRKSKGLTYREFLYRPAFELGRHLIGYEVQKVLAGVESNAVFPWKLSSSADDIPVCESVEPIIPNL